MEVPISTTGFPKPNRVTPSINKLVDNDKFEANVAILIEVFIYFLRFASGYKIQNII